MDHRLPEELETEVTNIEQLPAERQDRLRSLIELQRRGMSNAMIAKILHVGEATIYRDKQILKKFAISRAVNIDIKEEIGEALNFFDEIADKAMEGFRSATEDNEQVVIEVSASGEKKAVTKNVADHSQANRYLMTATSVKKQKLDSIMQVTATHALNKVLLSQAKENEKKDVSKLWTDEEFAAAIKITDTEAYEVTKKIHIIRGPSPLNYSGNHKQYETDMAEHMKKLDEFMKTKQEFEKPWPSRKIRKKLDQPE